MPEPIDTRTTSHNEATAWDIPTAVPALPFGDVHVWWATCSDATSLQPRLRSLLSPHDRARVARITFAEARERLICSHGLLQALLAGYLKVPTGDVPMQFGAGGKPALAAPTDRGSVRFNLSHTDDGILIAVARGQEVGVDVETLHRMVRADEVSERFFHADEVARLRAVPEGQRHGRFFRYWTAKEAVLKATGQGLAGSLARCCLTAEPTPTEATVCFEHPACASTWLVRYVEPSAEYLGAVTAEGSGWRCRTFHLTTGFMDVLLQKTAAGQIPSSIPHSL